MPKVTPWLWFEDHAEEAATLYTSLIANSRIVEVNRYGDGGPEPAGKAFTLTFELDGQTYCALNGGPDHQLTEAFSIQISCDDQNEIDRYWDALIADGGQEGPCGWLIDRFGLSWQIMPSVLPGLLGDPDPERAARAREAMFRMKKLVIAELEAAANGD